MNCPHGGDSAESCLQCHRVALEQRDEQHEHLLELMAQHVELTRKLARCAHDVTAALQSADYCVRCGALRYAPGPWALTSTADDAKALDAQTQAARVPE